MRNLFLKFRKSEDGATLVEYGVALILAIVVGGTALLALGGDVSEVMGNACTSALADGGADCAAPVVPAPTVP
ncbi:Flp family type IVb pilin [Silicimonas algicola]|uniref:Flp pilus assembly pilin Flp n=1 Tax=Silicimonas algicola TaxID=1826607 RepID=A0A316G7B4_9RHOB|nr:hypothetical protein [Silicimonas algicola]PWK56849.1 Flp pilus assembly pilin Flp [Silicimonas algicola]